jgi:ABC-type phosphate/phosphonate transport system substrate-binding protein
MENCNEKRFRETFRGTSSRRQALALMLGTSHWLAGAAAAADDGAPVRMAISENMVGEVNLNDARAAMSVWVGRLTQDLNVVIDSKLFCTTQEIIDRVRNGQLDAIAVNVLEYRQIAEMLDSTQIVGSAGATSLDQYLILTTQNSGIRQLGDLKGRRLCMLKNPKMCVAPAWLLSILDEGRHGSAEQFFGTVVTDAKPSRVVLPVFFGQADACLTTKRGFDTMCELNPQVARDLKVIASSPTMVVSFYVFRKNFRSVNREKLMKAILSLTGNAAGRQLATLFQFEDLGVRDASCLTSVLSVLDAADRARARARRGGGSQKG